MEAYEPKESPWARRLLRRPLVDADLEFRRKFGCQFLAGSAVWAFAFVLPKSAAWFVAALTVTGAAVVFWRRPNIGTAFVTAALAVAWFAVTTWWHVDWQSLELERMELEGSRASPLGPFLVSILSVGFPVMASIMLLSWLYFVIRLGKDPREG